MDRDKNEGTYKEKKGAVKEAAGKLTDDDRTKRSGQADQTEGKVQRKVGEVKESFKKD